MLVNVPLKFRQRVYTRLPGGSPCIKMVICTAAVQEAQPNQLYTRLPGTCQHKIAIYTAAVPEPIQIYTRLPCVHNKSLFTRQPFKTQIGYIHCSQVYTKNRYLHASRSRVKSAIYIAAGCIHKTVIYTAAIQDPIQDK